MEPRELLRQALESIADHPRRAVASSMGVFWGAATIVLLLAWGTGFREYMHGELQRFGRGVVFLAPGITSSGFPGHRKGVRVAFSRDDAEAAERANAEWVEAVLAEHASQGRVLVESRGRARRLDLAASDARYAHYRRFAMAHGRFFDADDAENARPVAVLGPDAARDLFGGEEAAVGRLLRVDGRPFRVIGVTSRKGRQYTNTNRPDNRLLMVPASAAERRLGYDEEDVSRLLVIPRPGADADRALRAVRATLGPRAGFHPDDTDALRQFDMTAFLGLVDLFYAGFMVFIGVAGTITLLIGGVGIANYHLATLAERTVEIAVARAIGARSRTLALQTALESFLLSGTTTASGVLLGVASCRALAALAPADRFPTPILSPLVAVVSGAALLAVALVAAALPALRVRRLEVAAALRDAT